MHSLSHLQKEPITAVLFPVCYQLFPWSDRAFTPLAFFFLFLRSIYLNGTFCKNSRTLSACPVNAASETFISGIHFSQLF